MVGKMNEIPSPLIIEVTPNDLDSSGRPVHNVYFVMVENGKIAFSSDLQLLIHTFTIMQFPFLFTFHFEINAQEKLKLHKAHNNIIIIRLTLRYGM